MALKKMNMKSKIILFLLLLLANVVRANDGRFYISGNHLVPISDADIRIDKEILTIRIANDGFAYVDVDYTFNNLAEAKNVRMGFEAAIENDWANVLTKKNDAKMIGHKGHPNIFDFVVEINGKPIGYQNRFAFYQEDDTEKPLDYEHFPVDKEWVHGDFNEEYYKKFEGWDSGLYNAKIDSSRHYAHVYYFEAPFKSGINKVHHTYRYEMGNGLDNTFDVRYWLTPALRWAGNKIGDFTLRISAEGTAKHFFIYKNKCFEGVDFKLVKGVGKMRSRVNSYKRDKIEKSDVVEVSLRNGVIEWHKTDFHPTENLIICSADNLKYAVTSESLEKVYGKLGEYYDRSGMFFDMLRNPDEAPTAWEQRLIRNLPYANRGYVFKNAKLKAFFEKQWWYMPDPSYKPSTADFTKFEQGLLKGE